MADMIGPLLQSKNNDAILVVVNRLTKIIWIIPTSVGIISKKVTKLYKNNIWKLYGIPRKIILDRGPLSSIDSLGPIQTNTDQLEPPLHLFPRLGARSSEDLLVRKEER